MRHLDKWFSIMVLATFPLLAVAWPVSAEVRQVVDRPLQPAAPLGFVQLSSCVVTVELGTQGNGYVIRTNQAYRFHNRDRTKGAVLLIGLPSGAQDAANEPTGGAGALAGPALRDDSGNPLPARGPDARFAALWEIGLAPNESKTVALSTTHTLPVGHFLRWRWDAPLLAPWGAVEGARVELRYPARLTDDALLRAQPANYLLLPMGITWDYESPTALVPHEVMVIAPATWQEMLRLREAQDHHNLARLYREMQAAAQNDQVPFPDLYAEIVAELLAAAQTNPANIQARLDLAEVYRARAKGNPDLQLNYLLLAAQELTAAQEQLPRGDGSERTHVTEQLIQVYREAATLASTAGDSPSALRYMQRISELSGGTQQDPILSLRWAIKLAEQGASGRSWEQIDRLISAQMRDVVLYHAPPALALHTAVDLQPDHRQVRYRLQIYPPSETVTLAYLDEVASRLRNAGQEVSREDGVGWTQLAVRISFRSDAELRERSAAVTEALAGDSGLLPILIAAPWQAQLTSYSVAHGLWRDSFAYREQIDLSPVQEAWSKESAYTSWRLVELQNHQPADERGQLERRLAMLILQDQRGIWERLPGSSLWAYHVTYPGDFQPVGGTHWLVSWGQRRELEAMQVRPRLPENPLRLVIPMALFAVACAVLWAVRHHR